MPEGTSWEGRALARRVWITNSNGKSLFCTTPRQAHVLLSTGAALALDKKGKLWRVVLTHAPGNRGHVPSARDFATPAPVFAVRYAGGIPTYEFKPKDSRDRWAYLLTLTGNISNLQKGELKQS